MRAACSSIASVRSSRPKAKTRSIGRCEALPGLELWPVTAAELPGLESAVTARGLVRTHPGMAPGGRDGGMDGFFVARFRRR